MKNHTDKLFELHTNSIRAVIQTKPMIVYNHYTTLASKLNSPHRVVIRINFFFFNLLG